MLPGDRFCLDSFPPTVKTVIFLKLRARGQGKVVYFSEFLTLWGTVLQFLAAGNGYTVELKWVRQKD